MNKVKSLKKIVISIFIFIFLFTLVGINNFNGELPEALAAAKSIQQTPSKLSKSIQKNKLVTIQSNPINDNSTPAVNENVYANNDAEKTANKDNTITDEVYGEFKDKKGDKTIVREDKEKRTRNSKHYLLDDGTYRAEISMGVIHFEDENGNLQDINTALTDEADLDLVSIPISKDSSSEIKSIAQQNIEKRKNNQLDRTQTFFRALQVPFDVSIPKNYKMGYSIGKGSDKLTFIPVGASSVMGSVYQGNQMKYVNAWNAVDVILEVKADGLKESLILKDESAPAAFSFEVRGQLADDLSSGKLMIEPAWLEDANGNKKDVEQKIRHINSNTYIDLIADLSGLVYPIMVDPTVTLQPDYTQVKELKWNNYDQRTYPIETDGHLTVGPSLSWNGHYVSFIEFDNLNTIPTGSNVINASLNLYVAYMYYNSVHRYGLLKIDSSWNESTGYYQLPNSSGAMLATVTSGGAGIWDQFDITNEIKSIVDGTVPNYGWRIFANTNDIGAGKSYASSKSSDPTKRPKLVITYNSPPTTPTVLQPNGGEYIGASQLITWSPATDLDTPQGSLAYNVQVSYNGGNTWSDVVALTSAGATSFNYSFAGVPQSNTTLVRVRAYDGSFYGPFDQSNAVFTNNRVPNTPVNLIPGSTTSSSPVLISGTTPTFNWTFTDPDAGDTQSQFEIVVYNTATSTIVHDSGWVISGGNSYTVPSSLLSRNTTYNWQVKVKDNKGAASIFSAFSYIKINSLPLASITSYTDGQQLNTNILNFTWNYSDSNAQAQSSYQVVGSKDNWVTWAYNSGEITSASTAFTTPRLADGTWNFAVRVKDGYEFSNWSYRNNVTLPNSFEPNDTSGTAFSILYNTLYTSIIESSTDLDFYGYTASSSGIDQFTLTVPADKNYDVYIYDANMNLVTLSGNGAGINEKVIYDVTGGQSYYIKIVGISGVFSTTANYSFQLKKHVLTYQTSYQYDTNGNLLNKTTTVLTP